MSCCEKFTLEPRDGRAHRTAETAVGRRTVLKGVAGIAGGLAALSAAGGLGRAARAQEAVRLAFCGQLLCVVPYEVTQSAGLFADEGLDVELVYTRGGSAAMQALVGGAVDYAGTSFDARSRPSPRARRSAASPRPAGCRCSHSRSPRPGPGRSPRSSTSRAARSGSPASATPTTPYCQTTDLQRAALLAAGVLQLRRTRCRTA